MRLLLPLTAVAAAAAILAAPSNAGLPTSARTLMEHRESVTPSRHLLLANRTVKHARDVLGFLHTNPTAGTVASRHRVGRDYRWLLRFGLTQQTRARERIEAATRPAHYALWMCIHGDREYRHAAGGEGAWYSVNPNGHYNGLQMTWGWGELDGNPNNYTPAQILRAAENGYRASHYSRAWLEGQWGETVGPCWQYA